MFRLTDNRKQAIAIGAILLSLSALAQNSGIYCSLGACGTESVASSIEAHACCHDPKCQAKKQMPAPCEEPLGHRPESCPCPDSCWCHQAPQPFELPKPFDEPIELAFMGVFATCSDTIHGGIADHSALTAWSLPPNLDGDSTVCRCAKLCRFLI